jgi:hypothetical protein
MRIGTTGLATSRSWVRIPPALLPGKNGAVAQRIERVVSSKVVATNAERNLQALPLPRGGSTPPRAVWPNAWRDYIFSNARSRQISCRPCLCGECQQELHGTRCRLGGVQVITPARERELAGGGNRRAGLAARPLFLQLLSPPFRGRVGTGRRARLRSARATRPCGFNSHRPHPGECPEELH